MTDQSRIDALESRVTELEEDIRQANQTNDRILTLMRHHGLLIEPDAQKAPVAAHHRR